MTNQDNTVYVVMVLAKFPEHGDEDRVLGVTRRIESARQLAADCARALDEEDPEVNLQKESAWVRVDNAERRQWFDEGVSGMEPSYMIVALQLVD